MDPAPAVCALDDQSLNPQPSTSRVVRTEHARGRTGAIALGGRVMAAAGDYLNEVMSARWTAEELCCEKDRRLTEDLQTLGPRPAWWRRRARWRHDRSVQLLKKAHDSDLRTLLTTQDPLYRATMAHLI